MLTATHRHPLASYGAALRHAAAGTATDLHLLDPTGQRPPIQLSLRDWCGPLRPGDISILDRCHGATLDVGCGPGRLTAALAHRAIPALGIDVSAEAVRQTQRRGGQAQLACVLTSEFTPAAWRHLLLADGNIGIGGDPPLLLTRCRNLLQPGGDLIIEVDPPGTGSWSGPAALGYGDAISTPFAWAAVAADDIAAIAHRAAMTVADTWTEAGRWFVRIEAA